MQNRYESFFIHLDFDNLLKVKLYRQSRWLWESHWKGGFCLVEIRQG